MVEQQDNSEGCEAAYVSTMNKTKVEDPQDGLAAHLDQRTIGTCFRYALSALLYE